jgi:Pyruvate/2-oxoacid:ferredoxin oxidoreductase gamma subunit
VNVGVLGAFAAITKEISLPSLLKAIEQEFEEKPQIAEKNKKLAELVYNECLKK